MLGDTGGHEKQKEADWPIVHRAIGDAGRMAADHNRWTLHQPGEGRAGVGQGDSIADACAVQILPFLECLKQCLARFGASGEFRQQIDQLAEDLIAVLSLKMQLDGARGSELSDTEPIRFRVCHGGWANVGGTSGSAPRPRDE
jgi:hypothetical protein